MHMSRKGIPAWQEAKAEWHRNYKVRESCTHENALLQRSEEMRRHVKTSIERPLDFEGCPRSRGQTVVEHRRDLQSHLDVTIGTGVTFVDDSGDGSDRVRRIRDRDAGGSDGASPFPWPVTTERLTFSRSCPPYHKWPS